MALAAGLSLLAFVGVAACGDLPRSFSEVSLEQARALMAQTDTSVVDTSPSSGPGMGIRWHASDEGGPAPTLDGPVLVLASDTDRGLGSAAALARAGNRHVYLFISQNEEERSALVAFALEEGGSRRP